MYVPLDNLYDWIADRSDDTVIYRWKQHGSKNLGDLRIIDARYQGLGWQEMRTRIPVICHDQEPLQPDLYDLSNLTWQQLRDWVLGSDIDHEYRRVLMLYDQRFWQDMTQQNLGFLIENSTINDRFVLLHSERNSRQLEFYQHQALGCFWWSHAMIARDWYRYAQHDRRLLESHDFAWDFNVYTRAWSGTREYRLLLLQAMVEQDLLKHSRITFAHHDRAQHYRDHVFSDPALVTTLDLDMIPDSQIGSDSSAGYDADHYADCALDIVAETLFESTRQHLTEKILRPIACGKPFLLLSSPGSLEYLRHYGFQTFAGLIDEHYDQISDPRQRLLAVVSEMKRIARLDPVSRRDLYRSLHARAQHNKRHFFSDAFAHQVTGELEQNLQAAIQDIKHNWRMGRKWLSQQRRLTQEQKQLLQTVAGTSNYRLQRARLLKFCLRQRS